MDFLTDLVNSTFYELGGTAAYSESYISGWYLDNSNIGKLNNLIDTDFSGQTFTGASGVVLSGVITPDMDGEQQAIYKKLFEYDYFTRQAKFALSGITLGDDWLSIREGDSSIVRHNKNESAKTLRSMSQDSRKELELMAINYLKFRTTPEHVIGDDTVPGGFYYPLSDSDGYDRAYYNK